MFDTVGLQINELSTTHRDLYNFLITPNNGFVSYDVNLKKPNYRYGSDYVGGLLQHEIVHFQDSGKYKEKFRVHSRFNPSSHYKIIFLINPSKDCCTVEFSIPKYFYGTNIIQAVQNVNERDFVYEIGLRDTWEYQQANCYDRLRKYIKAFFLFEFPTLHNIPGTDDKQVDLINYSKIEIIRLDLCFNQLFNSKSDSLQYLTYQRLLAKKHEREKSRSFTNYKTSIMFTSKTFSSKIYHKGSEYEKNDIKIHQRINAMMKKQYFDVERLKDLADRTLRYEMTFRKRHFDYLYNQKVFRVKSRHYKSFTAIYAKLKSFDMMGKLTIPMAGDEVINEKLFDFIIETNQRFIDVDKKLTFLDFLYHSFQKYKADFSKLTINQMFKLYYKFYTEWGRLITTSRRYQFSMTKGQRVRYDVDVNTNKNIFKRSETWFTVKDAPFFYTEKECHFSNELVQAMCSKMDEFMKDFKVLERKDADVYLKLVDEYNSNVDRTNRINKQLLSEYDKENYRGKGKISRNKIGVLLLALDSYSFKDACDILGVTRSTMFRYAADLKKIGYTKHVVMGSDLLSEREEHQQKYGEDFVGKNKVISASLTFERYFSETEHNRQLFVSNVADKLFS